MQDGSLGLREGGQDESRAAPEAWPTTGLVNTAALALRDRGKAGPLHRTLSRTGDHCVIRLEWGRDGQSAEEGVRIPAQFAIVVPDLDESIFTGDALWLVDTPPSEALNTVVDEHQVGMSPIAQAAGCANEQVEDVEELEEAVGIEHRVLSMNLTSACLARNDLVHLA